MGAGRVKYCTGSVGFRYIKEGRWRNVGGRKRVRCVSHQETKKRANKKKATKKGDKERDDTVR